MIPRSTVLLATWLLFPAAARAPDVAGLPVAPGGGDGLVVVVQDLAGRLGTAPIIVVEGATAPLLDDGAPPDLIAGDGVRAALLPQVAGPADVSMSLQSEGGAVEWEDHIPVGPGVPRPEVRILVEADRVRVALQTRQADPGGAGAPQAGQGASSQSGPTPSAVSSRSRLADAMAFGAGAIIVQACVGLLGLAVGLWLGLRRAAAPSQRVSPVAAPPAEPGVLRVLRLPAGLQDRVFSDLACTAPGAALLVPRGRCPDLPRVGHVARLQVDRPAVETVLQAAAEMARFGPLRLLVEGSQAVAAPAGDESPSAPIHELCAGVPKGVELVLLLSPGDPDPSVGTSSTTPLLQAVGDTLQAPQGEVLHCVDGQWRFA